MSDYEKNYKNLTKASDFIVLVSHKFIPIVNSKLATHTAELNEFINTSNIIGLKKKHLIWNELLKNYTTMLTGIDNLVGFSHTMNYARKSILKELETVGNADYIKKKIELLEKTTQQFIDYIKVLLLCLEYFAKNLDISAGISQEIKNLNDVHRLITDTSEVIEKKHFTKVKQIDKEILEKVTKQGSFESQSPFVQEIYHELQNFSIKGGFEKSNLYQIITGGTEEPKKVLVGGFRVENYIKQQHIQFQLMKKEIKNLKNPEEIKDYHENFAPTLELFSELADIETNPILKNILIESKSFENISNQFKTILIKEIPKLLNYHIRRFNIANTLVTNFKEIENTVIGKINYSDNYGKINAVVNWNYDDIFKSTQSLIDVIKDIFQLIDKADIQKVVKDAKGTFKEVSGIKNSGQFNEYYQKLQSDILVIIDPEFSFTSRKNAKRAISEILKKIEELLEQKIILTKFVRVPFKAKTLSNSNDSAEMLNNLEQLIQTAEYVLDIESLLVPVAKEYEIIADKIANEFYNLLLEINTLISPDNKHTCIKRPSLVINTALTAATLENLAEKTFKETSINQALQQNIKMINDMLVIDYLPEKIDINKIYNSSDGLNLNMIGKIASYLCGNI